MRQGPPDPFQHKSHVGFVGVVDRGVAGDPEHIGLAARCRGVAGKAQTSRCGVRLDQIIEAGFGEEASLKLIDKEVREIVTAAADFAESTPEPELAELYTDVLVGTY